MSSLSDTQVSWIAKFLGVDPTTITDTAIHAPIHQAGAVLDALGAGDEPPNGGDGAEAADGGDLSFTRTGPGIRVPVRPDGSPARVIEINAGAPGADTDLGLPPDPLTGGHVDPALIDLQRTDPQRPAPNNLNVNEPIPAELQGQFDTVISNNPHGYHPNMQNVSELASDGGRVIMQGHQQANKYFRNVVKQASPADGPPRLPPRMRMVPEVLDEAGAPVVNDAGNPVPMPLETSADVMGGPFNYTSGEPQAVLPNTRLILEKAMERPGDPLATRGGGGDPGAPAGGSDAPDVPVGADSAPATGQPATPDGPAAPASDAAGADAGAEAEAAAGADAGLGGAAEAGLVGGLMAGGLTLYDDVGKVRSGQMSATDAVKEVGEKTGEVGALTVGGKMIADAAGGAGDAAAGAAGDAAGAGLGAAGAGGVIGGVVAGGMALIDDIGKVEDGTMTGGHATVDVTAKTAVGIGAGMAGAAAGAEIGAAVGSVIPGAGTVIGLAAGAVIGGAVGYVGNKLMNTETGQAILNAAGDAVDATIDGVKEAGEAIGDAASAAGSAISDAAGAAAGAASDAARAVENTVSDAASAVGGAVEDAAGAAADVASSAASAVSDAAGSAVDAIKDLF